MRTPGSKPGARGMDTGLSLGSEGPLFTPAPRKLQGLPVVSVDHDAPSNDGGGDGRLYLKLGEEAALWLKARRKTHASASNTQSRHARMRSWRAST